MRSRKRRHQNKPLERLALFKAKPLNRDTLRALGFSGRRRRSPTEPSRAPGPHESAGSKLDDGESSTRHLRATTEAERQANLPRMLRARVAARSVAKNFPNRRQGTVARNHASYAAPVKIEHKQGVCLQCGAKKSPYYACRSCGFSLLPPYPKR